MLTQRATEVTDIDGKLAQLAEDMVATMHEARGVGLAAPQVGVQKRLFVYQSGTRTRRHRQPHVAESRGEWEYDEGCLSIPGLFFPSCAPRRST